MSEASRRTAVARIGIAALNLLAPGLGLLRLQRLPLAIAFLLSPFGFLLALVVAFAALPELGFRGWAALMGIVVIGLLAIYIVSIMLSWCASAECPASYPWWSRWYGVLGAFVLVLAVNTVLPDIARGYYRSFYIPSEAMMPTLLVNDRLVASMRPGGELRRGDVILHSVGEAIYIKRIAGLPGDRIAILDGVVVLNGHPVPQRLVGTDTIDDPMFGNRARRFAEQFPGETMPHEIYDAGYSQGDEMAEQIVAPGHVFVLGDNRDHSADSRFPRALMGVEQLPIADIRGRALFYTWGPSGRTGQRINP